MAACACVWAGVRYRLKAQQPHGPRPGVLDGERERARDRLARRESPSVLIDEGDRLVAVSRLMTPLTAPAQLQSLVERLARHVEGDRELTDPTAALIAIPGTRNENVHPARVVTIDAPVLGEGSRVAPRSWTLGEIEHATAKAGAGAETG